MSTSEPTGDARDQAVARIRAKRHVWTTAASFVAIEVVLVVIWALTTPQGHFWPIWPALGFLLAIGSQAWNAYGGRAISEEQIQREMDKGA